MSSCRVSLAARPVFNLMRYLWRDEHFAIGHDAAAGIIRTTRLDSAFKSLADFNTAYGAVVRILGTVERARYGLVLDIRRGSMKNDPVFESALARYRSQMTNGFRRVAVIVSSRVGAAQVERHGRADGACYRAFLDEDEAMEYAREPR